MGAWGTGNLENDAAMDWLFDCESAGAEHLNATLNQVVKNGVGNYLDADVGSMALAAAEVVAVAVGQPELSWAKYHQDQQADCVPSGEVGRPQVELALSAIEIVASEKSELFELWDETASKDEWLAVVRNLKGRLEAAVE